MKSILKSDVKDKNLMIRITEKEKQQLFNIAKEKNTTVSKLVRSLPQILSKQDV